VQDQVPFLPGVEQPLRGLPQLGRVTAPQPVGEGQMPVDVAAVIPGLRRGVVRGQQRAPVGRVGGVKLAQVDALVHPLEHREGERTARQRLQVTVREQPPYQRVFEPELGRVPVRVGEGAHRVEHGLQGLRDQRVALRPSPAGPAHPGAEHVRHRVLLGERQHDLARQPGEQERLHLGRAHPLRPAEVVVAAVVDDAVGAVRGGAAVGQVLGLVGGEELRGQHGPPVLAPDPAVRAGRAGPAAAERRQRAYPGPDERVVRGERLGDARDVLVAVGHPQCGLKHPARGRGVHLAEDLFARAAALC
jgi:hypothetical protein